MAAPDTSASAASSVKERKFLLNRRRSAELGRGPKVKVPLVGTVRSVCVSESFDLVEIARHFEDKGNCEVHRMIDLVRVDMTGQRSLKRAAEALSSRRVRLDILSEGNEAESPRLDRLGYHIFFFSYGILVWWSQQTPKYDWLLGGESLLQTMEENMSVFEQSSLGQRSLEELCPETCRWSIDPDTDSCTIAYDVFTVPAADPQLMLACSHGLAQSTRLTNYESRVEAVVQSTRDYPLMMMPDTGHSLPSSDSLRKTRGQLFLTSLDINLHTDMLDTPDYFWNHTDLEGPYLRTRKYMEITNRTTVLNKRLDVVQELFSILSDEVQTQTSNKLEWYIIWLLFADFMVELVLFIADLFRKSTKKKT